MFCPVDTTIDAVEDPPPPPEVESNRPALSRKLDALSAPEFEDETGAGKVLDGRFRLIRILGRGGMGAVWEAEDLQQGRKVAVKRLRASRDGDKDIEARLLREARAVMAIEHPGIVKMLDLGKDTRGRWFLVYELLRGVDLETAMVTEQLHLGDVWRLAIQTLDALVAAHENGIVHRDIKPANLFLVDLPDGSRAVRVLDFGIAKQRQLEGATQLTASGIVVGTPRYMSPEQARGKPLDGRADVYGLGAVLFRLVIGRTPFDEDNVAELMARLLREDVPPVQHVSPEVPRELAVVIDRALRRKSEDRWASAETMRDALLGDFTMEQVARGDMPAWGDDAIPTPSPLSEETVQSPSERPATPRRRRHSALPWVVAISVGLLAGAGGFYAVNAMRGEPIRRESLNVAAAQPEAPALPPPEPVAAVLAERAEGPVEEAPDRVDPTEQPVEVQPSVMQAAMDSTMRADAPPRMQTEMRPDIAERDRPGYRVARDYDD